jgi:hypothetical protein
MFCAPAVNQALLCGSEQGNRGGCSHGANILVEDTLESKQQLQSISYGTHSVSAVLNLRPFCH